MTQGVRQISLLTSVVLVVALTGPPTAALAATGNINTTAQGTQIALTVAGLPVTTNSTKLSWQTGQAAKSDTPVNANVPNVLNLGAVTANAGPATGGGGSASVKVAGLGVLSTTLGADAVNTSCSMTASGITGGTDTVNLKVNGATQANPGVNANIDSAPTLTGKVDQETATYSNGRLTWNIKGLNLTLNVAGLATGNVIVAESQCAGNVSLDALTTTSKTIVPGTTSTPSVRVTNTSDVAAPHTVITIPAPPSGWTVGDVTTNSATGSCTKSTTAITCSEVTVPGTGSVVVSLPTSLDPSGAGTSDWSPAAARITAVSTPIAALPGTTISVNGSGLLARAGDPASDSGTFTITPMTVAAGRSATTPITLANQGPSDAGTTITIPIGNKPAGITTVSAKVGTTPCAVTTTITCTGVTVPARGSVAVNVSATAAGSATPGTTWDLSGLSATLNGKAVSGNGRLLTISDPEVNINNGVTVTAVDGVPGGAQVTPTVKVANIGIVPATGTSITLPAPPSGYRFGPVTTTGGGTCTTTNGVSCTGVTVPAMGSVTVSIPVTLNSAVTADWTAATGSAVTATSGDSTGTATGPIVRARPDYTLSIDTTVPAPNTVSPGDPFTMTVDVTNQGPSDADNATFTVVAPTSTTFDAPLPSECRKISNTVLSCTVDLQAGSDDLLEIPLKVNANADPSTPLGGGCVSLRANTTCAPTDKAIPSITLKTPLNRRITIAPLAATIVPGTSGVAKVRVTSTRQEAGLSVAVPLGDLPTGFRVTSVDDTFPAGSCAVTGGSAGTVNCTGVGLTANQARDVLLTVALDSSVVPPARWTATGIRVSDGTDQVSVNGALAIADTPQWTVTATSTGPADNTVSPGDTTTITVVAHNQGPSDAKRATFTVTAPDSTTFNPLAAPTSTYCTLASPATRATCTVDLVDEADTPQLPFSITVAATADPFTPHDGGCVDVDGVPGCGPNDDPIDPIVLRVPFDRQVGITTTAASITPGQSGTGTVSVTAEHGALNNLTITIPLTTPAGLSVTGQAITPSGQCTADSAAVTCTGVNLADGATANVNLTIAATTAATAGTQWNATALRVARGSDSVTGRGRLATVTQPRFTLDVTFTPPADPIPPGGTGDLGVDIDNLGPSDAYQQTISVLAPGGATFGDLTGTAQQLCQKLSDTRLSCTFNQPYGAPKIRFTVPLKVSPAADPGTPLGGGCADTNNNGVCDAGEPRMPDIELAAPFNRQVQISTNPVRITPGASGTATVLLSASPAQTGLTVRIPTDQKPAEMVVLGLPTVNGLNGVCLPDLLGAIVCTAVAIPAGGTTISIPVTVLPTATADEVWASDAITATNLGGDVATGAGLLVRTGDPSYTLTGTVTGPAPYTTLPGDTATLTATIDNTGTSTATNALVTLQAPVGTAFGPLTGTLAAACQVLSSTRLSCRITLGPNDPNIVWQIPVAIPSNYTSTSVVGGCLDLDGDGVCGDAGTGDRIFPDILMRAPLGTVAAISAVNTPITPGTSVNTTISVRFTQARTGVSISIGKSGLPDGVTLTGVRIGITGCTSTANAFVCGPYSLNAGSTTTLTAALTATADAVTGSVWSPAVTLTSGTESVTRSVTAATVADADAPLTLTVVGPAPGTLQPGGTGDLTITVHNPGPSNARGARYRFLAPGGTTFGALSPEVDAFCNRTSSTAVDCSVDVNAGTDLVFVLQILVPPNTPTDTPVDGGCVDTNLDGRCTQPPDNPLPPIDLGTGLSGQVTIGTTPGTATPGASGTGYVTVTAAAAMTGVSISVPLTLPDGFTITGFSGPTGSTCANTGTAIQCDDVTLARGANRAVALTLITASRLAKNVKWTPSTITLTKDDASASGTGTILVTGDPRSTLNAVVSGPAGPVVAGGTDSMTVTVTNTGPSDAANQTAIVVAPAGTSIGTLTGRAATECTKASSTQLSCLFDIVANGDPVLWVIPLTYDSDATDPPSTGCVALNGSTDCGEFAVHTPLSRTTTVTFDAVTIPAGGTGTAGIVLAGTTDNDLSDLTLTVPLAGKPAAYTVTGASVGSTDCDVNATRIACTGLSVGAMSSTTVSIDLSVAAGTADGVNWTATNVTLVQDGYADDVLSSSGLLASTTDQNYAVTVTVGRPSVNPASPGQTAKLPIRLSNSGPGDASPYVMMLVIPAGLTPVAKLPTGCVYDSTARTLRCEVTLPAGTDTTLRIPLQVGADVTVDTIIDGGCVDTPTSTDPYTFDGICGDNDQLVPSISVVAPRVDLAISYPGSAAIAAQGGTTWVGLTYNNNGSQSAADVVFTIDPPDGTTVAAAGLLLDTGSANSVAGANAFSAVRTPSVQAADLAQPDPASLTDITCTPNADGDDNTVDCTGPNQAVGVTSQLWVQLAIDGDAQTGTRDMSVLISTTSPEGKFINNYASVPVEIGDEDAVPNPTTSPTATPTRTSTSSPTPRPSKTTKHNDNSGYGYPPPPPRPPYYGGPLPKTGQDLSGLLILSVLLVSGGVLARFVAVERPRRREEEAAGS